MSRKTLSRREFFGLAATAAAAAVMAACKPETVVQEVEKVIKETVIVEGTPQVVEKIVKETVIVEKEPEARPAAEGPIKVLYGTWGDPNFLKPIEADIAEFNEMQDQYVVEIQNVVGNAQQHYLTVFAAGAGPDSFFMLDSLAREFAVRGVCAPLDDFLDVVGGDKGRWYPELLKPYTVDGKLYGLPQGWGADSINFFNADLFEAADLESPIDLDEAGDWTWDVMREAAKKMTLTDSAGRPQQFGMEWGGGWQSYFPAMLAYGGSFFDEGATTFAAVDEGATKGIQVWADIRNVDRSVPIAATGTTIPTSQTFPGGGVGLVHSGFWFIGYMITGDLPFDWDLALPPVGDGLRGCTGGSAGVCVHSQSKAMEGAMQFAWHRNQESSQLRMLEQVADMSPVAEINAKLGEVNPAPINWSAPANIIEHFTQRPYRVGTTEIFSKYIQPALDTVTQGDTTAEEAMAEIADTVNEELAKLTDVI